MSAENEIQTNLAPVIGWRESVKDSREKFFRTVALGGLALSLTTGAVIHQETLHDFLPHVLVTRMAWEGQEAQTRFVDLQQLKEPYGVNVNQEIVDTTVDLVLSNLAGRGLQLNYSPEEFKSKTVFLPEKEYLEKLSQSIKDGAKPTSLWWLHDNSGNVYHRDSYLSTYLKTLGIIPVKDITLRAYKTQLVISAMLFQNDNTFEETKIDPINVYDATQNRYQVYTQMLGLNFSISGRINNTFARAAQECTVQLLLAEMPGFNENSYILFPSDRAGMNLLKELHESISLDPDIATRVFLRAVSVSDYLNMLGNGAEDSKQAGVQKIADLINKIPTYH